MRGWYVRLDSTDQNSPARLMLAGVALMEAGVLVLLLLLGVIPGAEDEKERHQWWNCNQVCSL